MVAAFNDVIEAKQFFVSRIVAAAKREGVPLSELETRVLYFTEVGSDTKPEYLEEMARFDEQYDSDEYENKIADLLKKAYDYDTNHPEELDAEDSREAYKQAYAVLTKEDHYIIIMIRQGLGWKLRKKLFGII